ncbi:hypothetical protein GT755_09805 [Herbidospora sp. NEAU-GS84]|uniref:Uncharacterized protein n=1 Tax=Herbidospora solisilvae TaxID=2696284 RepID=A0A7C9NFX2_9ACTN|nr:hypothetical protein [Herbidospora solisilvae]NAS21978.1 hypothetical protein [Herbidospora solisilvae]
MVVFTIAVFIITAVACVAFTVFIAVRGFQDRHYVRETVNEHTARFYRCGRCGVLHEYGHSPHHDRRDSRGRPVPDESTYSYGFPEVGP